jgi:hypothetical protein
VRIVIGPESLTTTQRLQLEGLGADVSLDPPVVGFEVVLERPALEDLRADATRLLDGLASPRPPIEATGRPPIGLAVLTELPAALRAQDWSGRVALHRPRGEVVAIRPPAGRLLGLAVDLGTTKLAAYLVDLDTGSTVGRAGAVNPQIGRGEDVMSRIAYANTGPAARAELRAAVVEAVGRLAAELCAAVDSDTDAIVDCVVVGNTAMHHLFAGLPVRQLGQAPYVAAVSDPLDLAAGDLGLALAGGARVYLPPLIAGFVGADHVAMLLATEAAEASSTVLALDIGTNTEISLAHGGRLWSCSTASGPAFEGAHITDGMRAAPGAIERVHYGDGRFSVQTATSARRWACAARASSTPSPRGFASASSTRAADSPAHIRSSPPTTVDRGVCSWARPIRGTTATSSSRARTSARSSSPRARSAQAPSCC